MSLFRKIIIFLICLIPWGLGALFQMNSDFYNQINLPSFAPPAIVFPIVWTILYILIAISIYRIATKYNFKDNKSYYYTLIINYIFNQSFTILFFALESPFLGLIATIGTFVSSLFLYYETKQKDSLSAKLLIPYIIWSAFATILSFAIYIMNL